MSIRRRIATVLLGGPLLIEVFAIIFNVATNPTVFAGLGAWRWPAASAFAALVLGWAILVFRGSLFFTCFFTSSRASSRGAWSRC